MKYIYIDANGYSSIEVLDNDPAFPGIPVTDRYSTEYLAQCVAVEDDVDVMLGSTYDAETGQFTPPDHSEPGAPPEEAIEE